MSGGSYNYLFTRTEETWMAWEVRRMADRLEELGYSDAAQETRRYVVPDDGDPIRNVWKAVEWFDSADWSAEAVHEHVLLWRKTRASIPKAIGIEWDGQYIYWTVDGKRVSEQRGEAPSAGQGAMVIRNNIEGEEVSIRDD